MADTKDVVIKLIDLNKGYYDSFITLAVRIVTLYLLICAFSLGMLVRADLFPLGRYMLLAFLIIVTTAAIIAFHCLLAFLQTIRSNLRELARASTATDLPPSVAMAADISALPYKMGIAVLVCGYFTLVLWISFAVADLTGLIEFSKPM